MVHIYPFLDNSLMQKETIKSLCCPPLHPLLFSPILQWLLNIIERSWRNHIRLLSRRTGEWVDSKLTIKTKKREVAWKHKRCLFIEVRVYLEAWNMVLCTHKTWFHTIIFQVVSWDLQLINTDCAHDFAHNYQSMHQVISWNLYLINNPRLPFILLSRSHNIPSMYIFGNQMFSDLLRIN